MSGWFYKNLQSLVIVSQVVVILLLVSLFAIRSIEFTDLETRLQNIVTKPDPIASISADSSKSTTSTPTNSVNSNISTSLSSANNSTITSTIASSIQSTVTNTTQEANKKFVPIVMYHHIHPTFVNSKDAILADLTMHPDQFEKNLKDIVKKNTQQFFHKKYLAN